MKEVLSILNKYIQIVGSQRIKVTKGTMENLLPAMIICVIKSCLFRVNWVMVTKLLLLSI